MALAGLSLGGILDGRGFGFSLEEVVKKLRRKFDGEPRQITNGKASESWAYNNAKSIDLYVRDKTDGSVIDVRIRKSKLEELAKLP